MVFNIWKHISATIVPFHNGLVTPGPKDRLSCSDEPLKMKSELTLFKMKFVFSKIFYLIL